MTSKAIRLNVNGDRYEVTVAPWRSLADVLREDLGLIGTKIGCNEGDCGACTVHLDGRPVCSCLTLAAEADAREVTTIEGLAPSPQQLSPLQRAFADKGAVQCGFCTAGMLMSATHLLETEPHPDEGQVRRGLSGNLCRCTGYNKIVDAIASVAGAAEGGEGASS